MTPDEIDAARVKNAAAMSASRKHHRFADYIFLYIRIRTVMLLLSGEKMTMQLALEKADAAAKKTLEDHKAEEIAIKQATERQELAE